MLCQLTSLATLLASLRVFFMASGSAMGVVIAGGAAALGTAALAAGLTAGIAAKEIYKRLTNNYDI